MKLSSGESYEKHLERDSHSTSVIVSCNACKVAFSLSKASRSTTFSLSCNYKNRCLLSRRHSRKHTCILYHNVMYMTIWDWNLIFQFSCAFHHALKPIFFTMKKKTVMGNTLVLSNKRKILQKDMNLVTVDSSFFSLFNRREFGVFFEVFAQFVSSKKIPFTLFW